MAGRLAFALSVVVACRAQVDRASVSGSRWRKEVDQTNADIGTLIGEQQMNVFCGGVEDGLEVARFPGTSPFEEILQVLYGRYQRRLHVSSLIAIMILSCTNS